MSDKPKFEPLPEDADRALIFNDWTDATGHLVTVALNQLKPDVRKVIAGHLAAGTAGIGFRGTVEPTVVQILLLDAPGNVVDILAEIPGPEPAPRPTAH